MTPNDATAELSAEEKAYFDSRGAKGIDEQAPAPAAPAPEPAKAETPPAEAPKTDGAEAKDDDAGDSAGQKFVPHAALHSERMRRQAIEKRERDLLIEKARLEERLRAIEERAQQTVLQQPRQQETVEQKLARLEREAYERSAAEQQEAAVRQLVSRYAADVNVYKADNKDFDAAYAWLAQQRHAELEALGLPPENIAANIEATEIDIVNFAYRTGRNPGEVIFNLAKARGFNATPPVPAAPPAPAPAEKVAVAAKGQDAGKSLGQGAGGATPAPAIEALIHLDDDEFMEATAGKKWERLFRS